MSIPTPACISEISKDMDIDEGPTFTGTVEKISESLKELFTCSICYEIMVNPVMLNCGNGHIYCKDCIDNHMKSKRQTSDKCPQCQNTIAKNDKNQGYSTNFTGRSLLSEFFASFCANPDCKEKIAFGGQKDHNKTCNHAMIDCPYILDGCQATLKRMLMNEHKAVCQYRSIACQYCSKNYIFCQAEQHFERCIKYPINCPNCNQAMVRDQLEKHMKSECLEAEVPCKYRQFGCGHRQKRREIGEHENDRVAHVDLMFSFCEAKGLKDFEQIPANLIVPLYQDKKVEKSFHEANFTLFYGSSKNVLLFCDLRNASKISFKFTIGSSVIINNNTVVISKSENVFSAVRVMPDIESSTGKIDIRITEICVN